MAKCPNIDFKAEDLPWTFCPSFPAAILFAVIYFLLTFAHVAQAFIFRKKFCWVIIIAGAWETAGFALRAVSTQDMMQLGYFIPQQLLIILAPLFINAFVYMVLGRMIHFFIPEKKCFGISARRLTLIFVLLDIISFLVQASSSSLMNSDDPKIVRIGINVYMGGIGLQELFILIFTCLAIRFQHRMNQLETVQAPPSPWRPLLYSVYAGLALITLRIIFRLAEFSGGFDSAIAKAEAAFYVLEALPMAVALGLFNLYHPGRFLVGPESEFPKKEKKEKKKKGKKGKKEKKSRKNDSADDSSEETEQVDRTWQSEQAENGGVLEQRRDVDRYAYFELDDRVPLQHSHSLHADSHAGQGPPYP